MDISIPCKTCKFKDICKFREAMVNMIGNSDLLCGHFPDEYKILDGVAAISTDCKYYENSSCIRTCQPNTNVMPL